MVGRPHYLKLLKNELHRSKDHGSRLFNTYDLGGALPFNIKTTQAGPWTRNSTPSGTPSAPQLGLALYRSRFFSNIYEQGAQLSISIPLFDWGSISSKKKAQLAEAKAQSAQIDERVLELQREVAELWNQWQAAIAVRDILQTQASRYEELARESRVGYDLGLLTLTDVLQTETAFRQAGVQLIQSQAEIRRLELSLLERTNLPWPNQLLEEQ